TSATISGLAPATYQVYVSAFNASGESPTSAVTVNASQPTQSVSASFTVSPSSGTAGTTNFSFIDQSSGPVASWLWQFGDGFASSSQNHSHTYSVAGSYTVTLQVWNATTTSTTSHTVVVAPYSAFRSLVSAAAQIGGAGNSQWRTELTLFNASSTSSAS